MRHERSFNVSYKAKPHDWNYKSYSHNFYRDKFQRKVICINYIETYFKEYEKISKTHQSWLILHYKEQNKILTIWMLSSSGCISVSSNHQFMIAAGLEPRASQVNSCCDPARSERCLLWIVTLWLWSENKKYMLLICSYQYSFQK